MRRYEQDTERMYRTAPAVMSLCSQRACVMRSVEALATLRSSWTEAADFGGSRRDRASRRDPQLSARRRRRRALSPYNRIIYSRCYVGPVAYTLQRPLAAAIKHPDSWQSVSAATWSSCSSRPARRPGAPHPLRPAGRMRRRRPKGVVRAVCPGADLRHQPLRSGREVFCDAGVRRALLLISNCRTQSL